MQSGEMPRVVYVGSGGRRRTDWGRWFGLFEPEETWRNRLAVQMESVCAEMARRGLQLASVTPVFSTETWKGSWTEGVWLAFSERNKER